MEIMEAPTQMTSNVPANIGSNGGFSEVDSKEDGFSAELTSVNDSSHSESEIFPVNTSSADLLLNSAKEDGFEEALKKLSNGDLDVEEIDNLDAVIGSDPEDKVIDAEEVTAEESETLHEQIKMLEEQVNRLEKDNKDLLERAKNAESTNQANQEIMLALAMALHELARKEENEEKKISILELIVNMLALFMTETMTDYHEEEDKKKMKAPRLQTISVGKMESVDRLMQLINEKRQGFNKMQLTPDNTPHIEKAAA